MGDLLVDPYIISAPQHVTQDEALIFIERPIRWIGAERRTGCRLVISDGYLYALWEENQYPTPNKLREIYRIIHNESFDAETVFRAFDQILSIAPKIEDITGITAVLIEEEKTSVVPATIGQRLPPKTVDALTNALAICALYTTITDVNYPLGFATDSSLLDSKDAVDGEFSILEFDGSIQATIELPLVLIVTLPLLAHIEDVLEIIDFGSICHDAECAIHWSWVQAIPRQDRARHPIREFIIREEFRQRISGLGLPNNMLEQVYRKIAYLICGLRPAGLEIEPLRADKGPNSAQIRRTKDGAKAFRMQISQYRTGHHVHYWHCSGGLIEVAWIGPHDDFYIPE